MKGQEIIDQLVRAEMPDMEQLKEKCFRQGYQPESGVKPFPRRPLGVAIAAAIIAVVLVPTALAYGGDIVAAVQSLFGEMAIERQPPIKGYIDVNEMYERGEYIAVTYEIDGNRFFERRGFVLDAEWNDGKHTVRKVAMANGEIILIKPKESDGFRLKEGEQISLYALLNLNYKGADKSGELVQIGCYLDGELYEAFSGKLSGGGATFTIRAPCDGEFMLYVINFCAGMQNYAELTVR
jgi:hypothetical protein